MLIKGSNTGWNDGTSDSLTEDVNDGFIDCSSDSCIEGFADGET